MINHGPQCLRNPSAKHPHGRQATRVKQFLGNRVVVVGKSAFGASTTSAAAIKLEQGNKKAEKVKNPVEEEKYENDEFDPEIAHL